MTLGQEPIDAWSPATWPLWLRRAFFVTLPISGPLWIVAMMVGSIVIVILAMPVIAFLEAKDKLWDRRPHERHLNGEQRETGGKDG